jgi:hypothetical protein
LLRAHLQTQSVTAAAIAKGLHEGAHSTSVGFC